ncbi:hypothetical protein LguiA_029828 [Lonicera macranthoides]
MSVFYEKVVRRRNEVDNFVEIRIITGSERKDSSKNKMRVSSNIVQVGKENVVENGVTNAICVMVEEEDENSNRRANYHKVQDATENQLVVAEGWIGVLGSIGRPLRHTELKVVDAETDEVLPPGSKGIVKATGVQVMKGYYMDGWLNTSDIGWIAPHHSVGRSRHSGGIVFLEGRAKDTIVLSTGENVEPSELEEAAMRSSLIQQIVVIGQEELLVKARNSSIVDSEAFELSKENTASLVYDELRKR